MSALPGLTEILVRSRSLGFLGPGDISTHIRHADGFVEVLKAAGATRILDLGSGGGLPGLVVALALPESAVTLLDANERRVAFLREAVRQLDINRRVDVVVGRAEDLARSIELREQFDAVVARSFGAPAVTAECAAGFIELGGWLLVSEPQESDDRWPADELQRFGLAPGSAYRAEASTIRELRRIAVGLDDVPRAVGLPGRRPFF